MSRSKIHLDIEIEASRHHIWDVLLGDETYRLWTSVFMEGSHVEGSWEEGSTVFFKDPNDNGLKSIVKIHRPGEKISLLHVAALFEGKEDTTSKEALKWTDLEETYELRPLENGKFLFVLDMDIEDEYKKGFTETWEKALRKLKELSEE